MQTKPQTHRDPMRGVAVTLPEGSFTQVNITTEEMTHCRLDAVGKKRILPSSLCISD